MSEIINEEVLDEVYGGTNAANMGVCNNCGEKGLCGNKCTKCKKGIIVRGTVSTNEVKPKEINNKKLF